MEKTITIKVGKNNIMLQGAHIDIYNDKCSVNVSSTPENANKCILFCTQNDLAYYNNGNGIFVECNIMNIYSIVND